MIGGAFLEKRILRAACIQSVTFLAICIVIATVIRAEIPSTVMANIAGSDIESRKSNHPDYVYVIDAGHGGADSGTLAINPKYEEKSINLSIAFMIKERLEKNRNVKVYMTREGDQFLTPKERVRYIDKFNPKMVISIHCNSADNLEATGVEVLYNTQNEESKNLSRECLDAIVNSTQQADRGLLEGDNIYIVRNTKVPIALVEVGFLSNRKELHYLLKKDNQKKIADAIVKGIKEAERKKVIK